MPDLPKELRTLIEQARSGHDPDDATRSRVRASLAASLAAGASAAPVVTSLGGSSTSVSTTPGAMTTLTTKLASLQAWLWTGSSVVVAASGLWAASALVGSSAPSGRHLDANSRLQNSQVVEGAVDIEAAAHAAPVRPATPVVSGAQGETVSTANLDQRQVTTAPGGAALRGRTLSSTQTARRAYTSTVAAQASNPGASSRRVAGPGGVVGLEKAPSLGSAAPSSTAGAVTSTAVAAASVSATRAGLSSELQLVRQATAAVGAGRFRAALAALNEHHARFPQGALVEERLGLQAVSLCSLDLASGAAYAQRFEETYPASPLLERVRVACGSSR